MRRPRIGIPLCLDERGRWRAGHHYQYLDRRYADAIVRAGGTPLQLPIQPDPHFLIDAVDGLLIPGGDDLPPERPPPAHIALDLVAETQVAFDRELVAAARARGLPILGICYGMQLLAQSAGGVLHGHLPSERPDAAEHRFADPDARHEIRIAADSGLARALGTERCLVNSLHHQAVRSVGAIHHVVAWSSDDVIEAIESRSETRPDGTPVSYELGVQWHPEKLSEATSERLFAWFIESCRQTGPAPRSG